MSAFARETIAQFYDEALPIFKAHYLEIAFYPDIPLSPNKALYEAAEREDRLRIFTIRAEGELIGYCVFVVGFAPHYSTSKQAAEDIVYLREDMRGKMIGIRFLKWCDAQLKAEGVQVVSHHVKTDHPVLGKLLVKLGYSAHETLFTRRLDWPE